MDTIVEVKRGRRRNRIAFSLLVFAFFVGVGSLTFFRFNAARAVQNHVEELKTAGEAVTLEEVTEEYRSLKAEENGAEAYSNAFNLMTNVALLGERKATEIKVDATKLLDHNRETYEQVHKENAAFYESMREATAKFQRTTYPMKFEEGLAMLLKHLKDRQEAFRLIELDALFAAEQKDLTRLFRDLEMMLTLANSVEQEPILISVLVRVRGISMGSRVTQLILQTEKLSDPEFARLRALWNFPPIREHFVRSLALERWVVGDLFTKPTSYIASVTEQEDSPGLNLLWQVYKISGFAKVDELNYMNRVRELQVLMSEAPTYGQHQKVQSLVAKLKQERSGRRSDGKVLSRMFLPGIYKASDRVIQAEAMVELVKLGLNIA